MLALVLAAGGVAVLTSVQLTGQPLGLVFAFANCINARNGEIEETILRLDEPAQFSDSSRGSCRMESSPFVAQVTDRQRPDHLDSRSTS